MALVGTLKTTFTNWHPQVDLGGEADVQWRENEMRRILFSLCSNLEGGWEVFFFSITAWAAAFGLTICAMLSPFEDITFCRRFFMILSSGFLVNQSFFLVNMLRDKEIIPSIKHDKPNPMRYYPEAYLLKRFAPSAPTSGGNEEAACQKMDIEMHDYPGIILEVIFFVLACGAIAASQCVMESSFESKMFLILVSCYLLSTSLNFAVVWRDRFASKVWKYQVAGPENVHKKLTEKSMVYFTRNIWQGVNHSSSWLMFMWGSIGIGAVVSLVFTLIYLKEFAKGDHGAGCGLVSASLVFTVVFSGFLAYVTIGPVPDWQKDEEKHLGFLGGALPVIAFFIVAIGLEIAGIILFKITLTQTLVIIMGELVVCDAIFNIVKTHFKAKRLGGPIKKLVFKLRLLSGESLKEMCKPPTASMKQEFGLMF